MDNQQNLVDNFVGELLASFFMVLVVMYLYRRIRVRRLLLISQGLECPICKVAIENPDELHVTRCGHSFHDACLQDWMNIRMDCPMCRGPLP